MSIKIGDGYDGGKKYKYGYGKNTTRYSEKIKGRMIETGSIFKKPDTSSRLVAVIQQTVDWTGTESPIKRMIHGTDSVWKKIKERIGFKDDHTDKNYRH